MIQSDLPHLFITGLSRSGTSMMSAIVNTTSVYHIAPETHYFDDLRPRMGTEAAAFTSSQNRTLCEDYFARRLGGYYGTSAANQALRPALSQGRVTFDALAERASQLGHGADAYFEAFCELHAEQRGKAQWGEKTPRHTFRIPEILQRYPSAKILVIIRDPRAIAASYSKFGEVRLKAGRGEAGRQAHVEEDARRIRRSFHPITQAMMWKSVVSIARNALKQFGPGHIRIVRYEDLVLDTEHVLVGISAWLGIERAEFRLEQVPHMNSADAEASTDQGVTDRSLDTWRHTLNRGHIAAIQSCAGRTMTRMGYELEPITGQAMRAVPCWAALPIAVGRGMIANRHRIGNPWQYLYHRAFGR